MSEYVEIEKKYQIDNESLEPLLNNFKYEGEKRVVDEYFDTPGGEWYQQGIFIRIRNQKSLDIKFNPDHLGKSEGTDGDHVSCHEYNFMEPFGGKERVHLETLKDVVGLNEEGVDSFESLIGENQLQRLLVIDKTRKTYTNDHFTAVIDNIQGLGLFLEVEYSGSEEQPLEDVLKQIDCLMEDVPAKPLASGSFEMILKKLNYDLYLKGKYLLEEDIKSKVA